MELYILSKQDLSILSICKLADYQINLDEETNAKSTFTLMKTNGLKKENYMVLNGLYRQFIFVIDDIQTEKESDVVTVTALDISNVFNRKVIEKNIDTMKSKSIEEFLANTISENFVNSDDTALNVNYIEIYWHTNTQGNVATNAENGLYNFHTFLTNCRQYKNIYTDFKLENLGNPQTVEGKRISVEAKNRKIVDISLHGESTQKTRSGKNLYNKRNVSGTLYKEVPINELPAGTYTLSAVATSSDTDRTQCLVFDATNNKNLGYLNRNVRSSFTFTLEKPTKKLNFYASTSYDLSNEDTFKFADIQIEQGTTATEYEPYGVMPSPDYPSPIENIEGKNKFNVNGNLEQITGVHTTVSNNQIHIPNTYGNSHSALFDYIEVEPNKDINISFDLVQGTARIGLRLYDKDKNIINSSSVSLPNFTYTTSYQGYWYTGNNISTTIPDNVKYIRYLTIAMNGTEENIYENLQIEKGNKRTPYVPYNSLEFKVTNGLEDTDENYQEQVATFPLGEEKLMEGSYLADDGIHHSRKQVVFDGSEIITPQPQTNETNLYVAVKITDLKPNSVLLSNYFTSGLKLGNNIGIGALFQNYLYFGIPLTTIGATAEDDNSTKTSKFKTWLSTKYANGTPITVEYELAEEEIVPYTTAQQEAWNKIESMKLYDGVNHISSDANMVLKYYPLEPVGLKFILRIDIENKQETTELIDTTLPEVADYNKIYEEDVTAKVQVYIREDGSEYNLYLKTDRTTTTNKDDPDRASGKIEVISVETADRAEEEALNVMKGNNYKHLVEFKIAKTSKLMDITKLYIGRPIRIKTEDDIYDSYISALTLTDENFVYFKSGSLRITLLDKLKKSNDSAGNKLDVSGGKITGNLNINGILKNNNKTILDLTYPIGSIYLSIKNTNPSSLFGGIWEAWGSGRVPVGVDTTQTEFETVEKIGGEKTHKLKVSEMPSHDHGLVNANDGGYDMGFSIKYQARGYDENFYTDSRGGSEAHNNLQPYITCYMFKRVG